MVYILIKYIFKMHLCQIAQNMKLKVLSDIKIYKAKAYLQRRMRH